MSWLPHMMAVTRGRCVGGGYVIEESIKLLKIPMSQTNPEERNFHILDDGIIRTNVWICTLYPHPLSDCVRLESHYPVN